MSDDKPDRPRAADIHRQNLANQDAARAAYNDIELRKWCIERAIEAHRNIVDSVSTVDLATVDLATVIHKFVRAGQQEPAGNDHG